MKVRDFINLVLMRNKPYYVGKAHTFQKFHPEYTFRNYFELAIAHQLANRPDFFFIQVGANDGIIADDLRPLIKKYALSGVCVEPLKDKFDSLCENYKKFPKIKPLHAALHPTNSVATMYRIDQTIENLPGWAQGIGSFNKEHLTSRLKKMGGTEDYVLAEQVPCVQFEQIFESENVDHLELLQIDAEGFDFEVIKMVDLKKIRPAVIRFEIKCLSPGDKTACLQYLADNNYKMIYARADIIAIDQSTVNQEMPSKHKPKVAK
jgi:FkbM family methyltransferase